MVPKPDDYPILVVDDELDNLDAFRFNFRKGFQLLCAGGAEEALGLLAQSDVAVIVTDQRMPKMTGLELLRAARGIRPDAIGVIVTAFTDVDVLIDAINLGQVYRYITKPWDSREVRAILGQAIERFHLLRENRRLGDQLRGYAAYLEREANAAYDFGAIVGQSPALRAVLEKVEQVARTDSTVLLRGETGTGKELVARAIHINSAREARPFVRVNCAALAAGVLESELFGHEKGAFTGAVSRRAGRFEVADGGTLFLDEVGDLPVELQVKLLRVLQEGEFERVGSSETRTADVRVVSATHRDLETLIGDGRFRHDLYYRLNVFPIVLPPLRERPDDIAALAEHFMERHAGKTRARARGFEPAAIEKLRGYAWPGNVRELENVVERAAIVARGDTIGPAEVDLGPQRLSSAAYEAPAAARPASRAEAAEAAPGSLHERLRDEEQREITRAVEGARGNIAAAARSLGINRSTLYYRLKKHGLLHLLPNKAEAEDAPA
ncbi:MAG: sigma-54 dependent transcriptional regulator [Myxococcota bacterium]